MWLLKSTAVFFLFFYLPNNTLALRLNITKDTNLVNLAYNLCSYNTFCRSENNSVPEGLYSCCAQCSCSDDCYLTNKCCPDADVENQDIEMKCRYQYEYFDYHRNIRRRPRLTTYYVIDTCEDEQDGNTVDGCLHPTALEDHVLVSDRNSTVVYKNRKCALCNGVQNYETWDLISFCPYDDALFSFERRNEYVLEQCNLVSKPPKNTQYLYNAMECSPETIDRCNVSKQWDFYDEDIDRACRQYNMVYIEEDLLESNRVREYRTYKNVYCYICNKRNGHIPNPQCFQNTTSRKNNPFPFTPFFSIMDLSKSKPTGKTNCKIDEIEDPFTGSCTQLYCPFGKTAVWGACVDNMQDTIVSLLALYTINVSYHGSEETVPSPNAAVFNVLTKDIQDKFDRASCDICDMKMFSENIFLIRARPNDQCPLSKILKVFRYIPLMSVATRDINYDSIQLRQTNKYSMLHNLEIGVLQINGLDKIGVVKKQSCFPGAHLRSKFFCKRIVYSQQVMVESRVDRKILEKLLAVSDAFEYKGNEPDKYVVCLSDYLQLVDSAASQIDNMDFFMLVLYALMLFLFQERR